MACVQRLWRAPAPCRKRPNAARARRPLVAPARASCARGTASIGQRLGAGTVTPSTRRRSPSRPRPAPRRAPIRRSASLFTCPARSRSPRRTSKRRPLGPLDRRARPAPVSAARSATATPRTSSGSRVSRRVARSTPPSGSWPRRSARRIRREPRSPGGQAPARSAAPSVDGEGRRTLVGSRNSIAEPLRHPTSPSARRRSTDLESRRRRHARLLQVPAEGARRNGPPSSSS